ncbi:MAG: iron ABC transporter permease [Betaproteobacteria bacterium]|nr:iron ABC transporter permease [Betaproteobacteria bacterium]
MSRSSLFLLCAVLALSGVAAGLLYGSVDISLRQLVDVIAFGAQGIARDVIVEVRLPRVLAGFACGALLAAAGALLQVLLRNPLADPYVLGVSGGAALGALGALALGGGVAAMNGGALGGAAAAIGLVFGLSFRAGDWNVYRLLLTGVVLSAGFSAAISLILTAAPQAQVKGMLFWLMGDLSYADSPLAAWVVLAAVLAFALANGANLNLLSLGQLKAKSLGVAVIPLQAAVYFAAALATVAAVMLGGAIGFVGLIVPHAIRLLGIADYRWLLPLAALLGGGFLALADTLARTLAAPQQLPVGVLTAVLGVPAMLVLLSGRR